MIEEIKKILKENLTTITKQYGDYDAPITIEESNLDINKTAKQIADQHQKEIEGLNRKWRKILEDLTGAKYHYKTESCLCNCCTAGHQIEAVLEKEGLS